MVAGFDARNAVNAGIMNNVATSGTAMPAFVIGPL
jgi:hypothetical protein